MSATRGLTEVGQSIWLDNITRDLITTGTLARYVDELSVTGITSNPTIFERAITRGDAYDDEIRSLAAEGKEGDELLFEVIIHDLTAAADILAPVHRRTLGVDGWVSVEVAPGLAHDAQGTVAQAEWLFEKAPRPNVFVKIPGTQEGVSAVEEATFRGIPVNVTLLFSETQYLASAEAYMRGIERRVAAGLDPDVRSVASLFVSRWDKATAGKVPDDLQNRLGIAVGTLTYKAYRDLKETDRWQRLESLGLVRSVCFSRAPARRIQVPRTSSTSRGWPRPTPSTPCPKRRCSRSTITARCRNPCPATVATPEKS